jgi:hypothetical protein
MVDRFVSLPEDFCGNIVGDIAGRFATFQTLLSKMPKGPVISVGDLVDRGPRSKEVVEWFMMRPDNIALFGNHEDLCVRYLLSQDLLDWKLWENNGGAATLASFYDAKEDCPVVSEEIVEWLSALPHHASNRKLIITHAPLFKGCPFPNLGDKDYFIWNRAHPNRRQEYQVYGHNGVASIQRDKYGPYAYCIDDSANRKMIGMHWPSRKLYTVNAEPGE